MALYLYGPCSSKDCDLVLLRDCQLNEQLRIIQSLNNHQFCSYGDGIFPCRSHLRSKNIRDFNPIEIQEKQIMTRIRIANEWSYGATATFFPFVKEKYSQKILHNNQAVFHYAVATLLRNAYICLYECKTSKYFSCSPPSLPRKVA